MPLLRSFIRSVFLSFAIYLCRSISSRCSFISSFVSFARYVASMLSRQFGISFVLCFLFKCVHFGLCFVGYICPSFSIALILYLRNYVSLSVTTSIVYRVLTFLSFALFLVMGSLSFLALCMSCCT